MKKQGRKPLRRQKGSALLVSLMVMVGLSLLGLGFVAVSETESAISINERNSVEVLSRAEAGGRVVVEWFQDPEWAEAQLLMPPNDGTYSAILTHRNPAGNDYGYYKNIGGSATTKFCDRPFKPANSDRFWGDEQQADIIINDTTALVGGVKWLDEFNEKIFGNDDGGRVTEIRIYAPPVIGGVLTARSGETVAANGGFYVGGVRYGLCTIKVTAQKHRGTQLIAERSVKIVLSEWPFPGPQGPVQSNASIDTGGNFGVHWGRVTAMETLEDSRASTSIPWHNAWDRINFEHGFESSIEWRAGLATTAGVTVVHPSKAAITASTDGTTGEIALEKFAYIVNTTSASMPNPEPSWEATAEALVVGQTFTSGGIQYTTTYSREYPRTHAPDSIGVYRFTPSPTSVLPTNLREFNYLRELVGRSFEDLWFEARARGAITIPASALSPQLFPYAGPDDDETINEKALFELQNRSESTTHLYRQVTFPRIDYEFWKDVAIQAAATGEKGVKYLRWVDTDRYSDGLQTRKFADWVNTAPTTNPAPSGYYFFDSKNGINPQNGNTTQLTPELKLNSSDANPLLMQGFVYLNSAKLNTTGLNGVAGYYNMPGEPYRDIGFRKVNDAGTDWEIDATDHNYVYWNEFIGNSWWDYQDVNDNHEFDVVLGAKTFTVVDGAAGNRTCTNCLVPIRWFPGCTVGTNCSEPHEPYLNIQYPAHTSSPPMPVSVTWGTNTTAHVARPKAKKVDGTLPNCSSSGDAHLCTSAKYDRDGGFVTLSPIMVGVMYNEGEYEGTGNAIFYGSLLINGKVGKAGTADVYFDESLIKGDWSDRFEDFPRVLITAHETDQQ